mgnify:CR=1 FL=1
MIDVNIYRYNPETDKFPYTQTYSIKKPEKDIMLLELLNILKEQDTSISYRRSCREGVCGSDGMNINGKNGLACITPISEVIKNNKIDKVYSKDTLLTNIMVYLVTNTFNTASWIYFGRREEGGRFFPKNFKKIKVPTAVAEFPKEMSEWPPRSYIKRIFNLKHWTKMKRGGHFAALEQPDLLVNDRRRFTRTLR